MRSYIVIGGRKCGSTSMQYYLQKHGHDCTRWEQLFTRYDGPEIWHETQYTRTPVIIIRNPVDRIWSDYWYARLEKGLEDSYEDYLKIDLPYSETMGDLNPLSQSNYRKWFKNWEGIDLKVRWLEDMKQLSDFPHVTNGHLNPIPEKLRKLTLDLLTDEITGAC